MCEKNIWYYYSYYNQIFLYGENENFFISPLQDREQERKKRGGRDEPN